MKRLYRYIVACIAMLCALQQLSAQETVITDQLIYDRVSGYMVSGDVELSQITDNIRMLENTVFSKSELEEIDSLI